jgi:pimeloyl-ACP methyl ester carboxylesterase
LRSNRFADHGSSRIAYELCGHLGRRKPWLVLIQGLGFDRSGWAPVISALRRRFRLVLIDNRGSGRSTTPDREFTVADMAADVAAVLDSSRIAHAHVLGASLGGMVAQARRSGFVASTCQRRRHLFRRDAAVTYPRADPDYVR